MDLNFKTEISILHFFQKLSNILFDFLALLSSTFDKILLILSSIFDKIVIFAYILTRGSYDR